MAQCRNSEGVVAWQQEGKRVSMDTNSQEYYSEARLYNVGRAMVFHLEVEYRRDLGREIS
jgi:hypothetical protein